jgi:hypothetical protein
MKELLKIFGVPVADSVKVSDISLAFHGISTDTALLIAIVVVAATWWIYLQTVKHLSKFRTGLLATLRSILLLMILLILMKPVLLLTVEGTIRRSLLVLIDSSASMQIKDLRQDPADIDRAAIAKGLVDPKSGVKETPPSDPSITQLARSDLVKSMLTNDKLNLLSKLSQTYDVVPYIFGQTLQAMSSAGDEAQGKAPPKDDNSATAFLNSIPFDKPYTAIGDAVRSLLDLKRGQPVAGILLITDGGNNYGSQPLDAAAMAQQDKVPLFIYGVGITSPHDIIVSQVYTPEVIFAKEEATATVTVRSQSMQGRTAKLVLKMGDEVVASQDVTFGDDGEQLIPMKFLPTTRGEYELTASIDPLSDEANKDNNTASQRIRVIDGKIQLLYIEQKPRWEFRYLLAMLIRDRRIDPHFYLVEGDPALSQEQGSPYLATLPTTKEDWMKYDVIIVGDVNSRIMDDSQMQNISDLVSSFGGGVIFLAGRSYMPDAYRRTPLEAMFPIIFEGQSASAAPVSSKPTPLDLTPAGQNSPTMRLSDNDTENEAIWHGLAGVYWDARVTRAKPAAEVLLDDPSPEKATRLGPMPVVALQSYGTGQVLFVGTDETWRWRKNVGEKYYTRFWGQVMLRLGLPRLMGASQLVQLSTEKKEYVSGERVVISGRLYRSGFQPVMDPTVKGTATVTPEDASKVAAADLHKDVSLQATPSRPGYYEGELVVTTPGIYSFSVDSDPKTAVEFKVTEPKFEFGETAMNIKLLQQMAQTSGGAFYREEDMYKLLEPPPSGESSSSATGGQSAPTGALGTGTIKVPSPQEVNLCFLPLYYALMILVASIEWVLRKIWQLK